jgi:hypothetical protein
MVDNVDFPETAHIRGATAALIAERLKIIFIAILLRSINIK